jgi:hypothetical protein
MNINNAAIDSILNGFLNVCSDNLVATAKEHAPVNSGALKDSIKVMGLDLVNKSVTIGSNLSYALPIEMGHMKKDGSIVQPQSYLRVALDLLPQTLGV